MVELIPSTTHTTGNFLQQPRSAFHPLELYESDVVWSFLPSPDSRSFSDSTSPSPPFMHDRRRHNLFSTPQPGLSAVLGDYHRRLVSSQSKIIPASPRSENVQVKFHHSAPVNIPVWPNKFHDNFNEINDGDGDGDLKRLDGLEEEDDKMVPPHVIVARSHVTFSVFEGVGRTLKGRDLRRVRNAVFQRTGFSVWKIVAADGDTPTLKDKADNLLDVDAVACDVVNLEHIDVKFDSIGGLDAIKQSLYELVILPLRRPELFSHGKLVCPQKGVLLYGPPGTGKTMLAKAIAKESGAAFINVRISNLMSKWFGDAQKLVAAVFTLTYQPAIIFIDEVDSFLGRRNTTDHEALTNMKTEFMALWDGLTTDRNAQVMVLAATNRPSELDETILRRLPQAFEIGIPDRRERAVISKVILKNEKVEDGQLLQVCNMCNYAYTSCLPFYTTSYKSK